MNNSLTGLIDGLSSDITGLNATLQQEILDLEVALKKDIGGLNKTMQQELYDIDVGLSSDIAGLDTALTALNASLHAELAAMETENQAFRTQTATTLQDILDRLDALDMNLSSDIDDLQTTVNNLNSTTLAQIEQQLTDIDNKIDASGADSSNDTKLVLEKITALKTDIGQFRSETGTRLDNITDLLAALDDLSVMAQNIKTIQQDTATMKAELARLSAIEASLKELEKKQDTTTSKVESSGSLNMAMVALLVMILVLGVVLLLTGRKGPSTSAPVKVTEKAVRRPVKVRRKNEVD
jgi:chromosome segregation ATPase